MNTYLFCPKCATDQYIIDESNVGVIAISVDACSMCDYQRQSGDNQRNDLKLKAARLALAATENESQMKAVMVYALLAAFAAFIGYRFLIFNHTTFGLIFSALAFILVLISVTGLIFMPKKH
jgi:hypothetical protein